MLNTNLLMLNTNFAKINVRNKSNRKVVEKILFVRLEVRRIYNEKCIKNSKNTCGFVGMGK